MAPAGWSYFSSSLRPSIRVSSVPSLLIAPGDSLNIFIALILCEQRMRFYLNSVKTRVYCQLFLIVSSRRHNNSVLSAGKTGG
jgi:hypothetical protein